MEKYLGIVVVVVVVKEERKAKGRPLVRSKAKVGRLLIKERTTDETSGRPLTLLVTFLN